MRGQARKARGNSVGDQDKRRCRRIEVVCGQVEAESKQTTRLQARDSLRHINITWGMSESVGVNTLFYRQKSGIQRRKSPARTSVLHNLQRPA